ncbi:hypothetical protein H1W37_07495 [Stappia taiwanensis]|uniref:4Fe-4S ferredoxin-type domain-containing protein n=1 Tax=Stappia taiwanensis TaxID=992267 RepID=A0A838XNY3_9HYPH|nr:hypothetical protein [Stappia taiwanensis]MBA4611487.1 hypothetical protein [Stappia taiwanensis]GGE99869.1 hypothetical protein GCM10007285_29380 [Stappia taiwanensis]
MDMARATRLSKALARAGFLGLGGFHPGPGDAVPPVCSGGPDTRTLLLIGSVGPDLFRAFGAAPEAVDGAADPLDRYTRRQLGAIAGDFGLAPLFPFDGPPYHPFQRWALRVGGFSRSPMGVLAHAAFGPWAGLRGALLSPERFGRFEANDTAGPCEACEDTPCVAACPAGALSLEAGYDVPRCRSHLEARPDAPCRSGCLARRACPFGRSYAQDPAQGTFHMRAFFS